ncbi:hypothetical protein E2C01_093556 [Portunus trituberculatus]|uniref:Uncharacterized protein n=1 Tax=Portunus trituberculatus TaxID=210409 RepID=A0A5B7JN15_PORTR|nr:hypothetical protein [Portunus trituberculatus]
MPSASRVQGGAARSPNQGRGAPLDGPLKVLGYEVYVWRPAAVPSPPPQRCCREHRLLGLPRPVLLLSWPREP